MHTYYSQAIVQVHRNRTAGFRARQGNSADPSDTNAAPHKHRVPVPPQTDIVHRQRHHVKIRRSCDQIIGNSCRAVSQAHVHLLQGNDIGVQFVDDINNAARIATTVKAACLANVIACDAQVWVLDCVGHGRHIGT